MAVVGDALLAGTQNNCTLYYMRWKNQPVEKSILVWITRQVYTGAFIWKKNKIKSIY